MAWRRAVRGSLIAVMCLWSTALSAETVTNALRCRVADETGGALPGVTVEVRSEGAAPMETVTDASGEYVFADVAPGKYQLTFSLINFATIVRRDVKMGSGQTRVDVVMHVSLNAEVAVVGKRTFANIEDMEQPEENLIGVAQAASQGAITSRQLDVRPLMRVGEVLEDQFPVPAAGETHRAHDQQEQFEHNADRGLRGQLDQCVLGGRRFGERRPPEQPK
jgi:hypothetical protein